MVNKNRNDKNKVKSLISFDISYNIHKHQFQEKLLLIAISHFDNIPCWDEKQE